MTVVGTGEDLALGVPQHYLGWGWPWQDLLLQDLNPSALELEIFRCSCCHVVGILVPRVKQLLAFGALWENISVETRGTVPSEFFALTINRGGQVSAVLICALKNKLLWIPKAMNLMCEYNTKRHFSSEEKYLDPWGKELFFIICILGYKSVLINADNTKSIVVGTQK